LLEIPISKKIESLNVSNAVSAFLSYYRFKSDTNP
jgi:tRNA G18 (ribose-2'-O)-methylase SpoU